MQVIIPQEAFPELGTVANPAVLFDGNDAFICYEASVRAGGGNVVLKFGDVIDFRITPMNVEGLKACRYPVNPWTFNEVVGGEETTKWNALNPRLWLISFNDLMVEVLFETVSFISCDTERESPHRTLMGVLQCSGNDSLES
ncbi:hypothetical protein IE4771_CH01104 [Rhizobium etli bv. mimosae str. IE4771]|uniref:Uncharacterized protein n=1 Tax=Rhizobium etli bv. mimosae str. IE4771 TaxID=1432050 RepID=A0A060I2X1_RHIET|nr:hypothetical protein [Rhizobium sp. IE4771]AIC26255.1 hypothetical protein IE4771_CH01104 [Rhizobium sp. IE4771]